MSKRYIFRVKIVLYILLGISLLYFGLAFMESDVKQIIKISIASVALAGTLLAIEETD